MATIALISVLILAAAVGLIGSLKAYLLHQGEVLKLAMSLAFGAIGFAVALMAYCIYMHRPLHLFELVIVCLGVGGFSYWARRRSWSS